MRGSPTSRVRPGRLLPALWSAWRSVVVPCCSRHMGLAPTSEPRASVVSSFHGECGRELYRRVENGASLDDAAVDCAPGGRRESRPSSAGTPPAARRSWSTAWGSCTTTRPLPLPPRPAPPAGAVVKRSSRACMFDARENTDEEQAYVANPADVSDGGSGGSYGASGLPCRMIARDDSSGVRSGYSAPPPSDAAGAPPTPPHSLDASQDRRSAPCAGRARVPHPS
jgi:hypothetical protein